MSQSNSPVVLKLEVSELVFATLVARMVGTQKAIDSAKSEMVFMAEHARNLKSAVEAEARMKREQAEMSMLCLVLGDLGIVDQVRAEARRQCSIEDALVY